MPTTINFRNPPTNNHESACPETFIPRTLPPQATADEVHPANVWVSMTTGTSSFIIHDATLIDILADIKGGRWREAVGNVRAKFATLGKNASNQAKKELDGFTVAGTFSRRMNAGLKKRSNLIVMDIDADHNPDLDPSAARFRIATSPYCVAAFLSPTNGVKGIFRCDPTRSHEESYLVYEAYLKAEYNLVTDRSCKDISRTCFVSFDPNLIIAVDPVAVIQYPAIQVTPPATAIQPTESSSLTADDVQEMLCHIPTRPDYDTWLKIISAVASVLDEEDGIPLLEDWSPEEVPGEYGEKWAHPLDKITIGTLFYYAKQGGWVPSAAFLKKVPTAAAREAERLCLIAKLKLCEFVLSPAPEKPIPRYSINGIAISTPGNVCTISAQAKTGKSAVVASMIAARIVAEFGGHTGCGGTVPDCLGITAATVVGALIHIDTEQSVYDHYQGIKRALKRAESEGCPEWLHSYAMAGSGPRELCESVRVLCDIEAGKDGVFAVIIDGVADLVSDVNEPGECNELVAALHAHAIQYNCSIIVVIHENPAATNGKSRGHLGSQLERKSETNLRLIRTDEVTQMYADKCRGAPIPKQYGPCFTWDSNLAMHVSVSTLAATQADNKTAELRELAEECLEEGPLHAKTYVDLRAAIVTARGVTLKTAERRLKAMKDAGVIRQNGTSRVYYREPIS